MEPRSSSADLRAPTLAGQRGRTSHMPLTTFQSWKMRFSIWIWMNKGPLWIVPRPLKRLVVRSRQRRCLSPRSSRSFQGGGLSPSQGESQVGGHSPGQGQTLLGTRLKVTEQMSMRFFQKLTDQQIKLNICTKKTGIWILHVQYSKYYSFPMINCV